MRNAVVSVELCRYSGSERICYAAMYTVSCCTYVVLRSVMLAMLFRKLFQNLNVCFSTGYRYNKLTIGDRACA